ncbi:MAG: hypothetical protein B6I28_02850 [Fusobacteriia bacterium 4572_132]|nr:MAG: hypothetical protein B6I28_02850 [Fusobacteriia bacterium 4572_132]
MKKKIFLIIFFSLIAIITINYKMLNLKKVESKVAKKGVLDLTKFDLSLNKPLNLKGEWQVTENKRKKIVNMPGLLKKDKNVFFESYELKILLNKKNKKIVIQIPRISNVYRIYINKKIVLEKGMVEKNKIIETSGFKITRIKYFNENNELNLKVECYPKDYKKYGIWRKIIIGSEKQIETNFNKMIVFKFILIGSLMIIGLYHVIIYIFNLKEKESLYFGIFSIIMMIRIFYLEKYLEINSFKLGTKFELKVMYLTYYLGVMFFMIFVSYIYKKEFSKKVRKATIIIGVFYSLIVLIFPEEVYEFFLKSYQNFSILIGLYVVYVIIKAIKNRRENSIMFLIGYIMIFIGMINEIIFLNTGYLTEGMMINKVIFIFLILQSILMGMKLSKTLKKERELAFEIKEMNKELEIIVANRTKELEAKNKELSEKVKVDGLTNLLNHNSIYENLLIELKRAERYKLKMSVLMCDIDDFKKINDIYGHQVGDKVLRLISEELKKNVRIMDIVGRYGGEEFIIIFPETSMEKAEVASERIRKSINNIEMSEYNIKISISGGLVKNEENETVESIVKRADKRMYEAKRKGKNKIIVDKRTML